MLIIRTKLLKDNNFDCEISGENTSVYEIMGALDIVLDALNEHDVSNLEIIDYVINREKYTEKESK